MFFLAPKTFKNFNILHGLCTQQSREKIGSHAVVFNYTWPIKEKKDGAACCHVSAQLPQNMVKVLLLLLSVVTFLTLGHNQRLTKKNING